MRKDGLLAENGSGVILGIGSLYGLGQGPQAMFLPGTISTKAGIYDYGSGGYSATQINAPLGMALNAQGKYVYFADSSNDVIRKMDAETGIMTVYAGSGGNSGSSGNGGQATSALLNSPFDVALDAAGNLYIADYGNNVVRKVDPTGVITAFAGSGASGTGAIPGWRSMPK